MIGLFVFSLICTYTFIKISLFIFNHAKKRNQLSSFPQLSTPFLIGETSFFKKSPILHHFIQRLTEIGNQFSKQDKLFITWVSTVPVLFIYNKFYIQQILSKNDQEFLNKGDFFYGAINEVVPNSLLTVSGEKWKPRRKLLSTPFHATNLDNFVKIVNFESKKLIKYFKQNPCNDLMNEMQKISIFILFKLLFEYDLEDEIDHIMRLAYKTSEFLARKSLSIFMISPFLYRFTSLAAEEIELMKDLMDFKNKIINSKTNLQQTLKSKLEPQNQSLLGKKNNLTLLEILLINSKNVIKDQKDDKFSGFDMQEVRAQLDTFIIAGIDTQSAALTFIFYHLAQQPEYQEKIYEEIKEICGDTEKELKLEQVRQLARLEAFINESMRIQPIIPLIARLPGKDLKLDDKYTIPAQTDVMIFIDRVLKDPDYFPDPFTFKPERFLGEDQKDNIYANIPFSAGPRNCVAKLIALQSLNFITADLLRNFRVEFTEKTPTKLEIKFELINKPTENIELKFVPRLV